MKKEKEILLRALREAGDAVKKLQTAHMQVKTKANNDIVTEADLLADSILKRALLGAFPKDGWLSEETVDNSDRLNFHRVWVVDPIDGTREYATLVPEYALSVALVEGGVPVLSAIYNPATNELFHASKGEGAWLGDQQLTCNLPPAEKLVVLASRSEYKRGEWAVFEEECQVIPIGSIAYKLALLAAGRAHGTFSLGPKSEWDIAAGVLLVQEAGGIVTDRYSQAFVFNSKNIRVSSIVATALPHQGKIFSLIANH